MLWFILILSGAFETVWAVALSKSNGFRKWRPTLLFLVTMAISLAGLAWAMTEIPTGTAYAVWVGVGASLTIIWSFITREESLTISRMLLMILLVSSIIGLKLVS